MKIFIFFLSVILHAIVRLSCAQDVDIHKINPYKGYIEQIEYNVKNCSNQYVLSDIYTTLKKMYPDAGVFDIKLKQETAGNDPLFLRNFTKEQVDRYGKNDSRLAIKKAFGLTYIAVGDVYDDPNFDKFLEYKTKLELKEEKRKENQLLHTLIKNNLETHLELDDFANQNVSPKLDQNAINILQQNTIYRFQAFFDDNGNCENIIIYNINDSIKNIIKKDISLNEVPFVEIDGVKYFVKSKIYIDVPEEEIKQESKEEIAVFTIVETQADFPGGIGAFYDYVDSHMNYPYSAKKYNISGVVYVSMIIEADGSLTNIYVVKGLGAGLDEEAIRLLEESPKWNPGMKRGEPVGSARVLPIRFSL